MVHQKLKKYVFLSLLQKQKNKKLRMLPAKKPTRTVL